MRPLLAGCAASLPIIRLRRWTSTCWPEPHLHLRQRQTVQSRRAKTETSRRDEGRHKRSRFSPANTLMLEQTASNPSEQKTDRAKAAAASRNSGLQIAGSQTETLHRSKAQTHHTEDWLARVVKAQGEVLARGMSSSFNFGEREETDDVDLLVETETPVPVSHQVSALMLDQTPRALS